MKVLLIQPYNIGYKKLKSPPNAPFGLMCLAAVLRKEGHNVRIFDRNVPDDPIKETIKKFWPDMIGISTFTGPMILDALNVAKAARDITGAPIVWGGIHPSLLPYETIKNPYVDIVVVGEGEKTILELSDAVERDKSLEDIKGLVYKENGHIHTNPERPFIKNLDELPMPAWDLIDLNKYETLYIFSSRGCPHRCGFCYNEQYNNKKWRGKSSDRVLEEVNYIVEKCKTKWIVFGDDNFTCNQKRLKDICNKIIKEDLGIFWRCESRVDYAKRDTLSLMKKAGCHVIFFGIESASQRILNLIKKDINISQVKNAFNTCKELGIAASGAFIVGLPTETKEELYMTRDLAFELPLWGVTVKTYVPYPGSDLYDFCVKNGLFLAPNDLEGWGHISSWDGVSINVSQIEGSEIEKVQNEIESKVRAENLPYYFLYGMRRLFDGDSATVNMFRGMFSENKLK